MATAPDPPRYAALIEFLDRGDVSEAWFTWFREQVTSRLNDGQTVTVTLAKITGGGTNGSLEFRNGLLVSVTQPT